MTNPPDWALGPHTDTEPGVEVRLNSDGTIDEICVPAVGFHLEQMDDGQYYIGLIWRENGVERSQNIMLTRKGKRIYPVVYR